MGTKILFVEDDPELRDFMKFLFEQENYAVMTAEDGEEGLRKARTSQPEVILLDVLLPKVNGFEVCDQLRQDPATCLIPIVMVTSLTAMKDRITGIKLGADEYVSKPFEPVELVARVERLLQRTRQNIASNPLTGLPGSAALEKEIRRRMEAQEKFSVGSTDASHLSVINDLYGYDRGDGVIRLLGTILRSAAMELGNRDDVVVHLGADDFAFVSTPARAEVVAARVLENVESLIPMQYDEESRARGYVLDKGKEAKGGKRPFLTMSIGIVDVVPGLFQHPAQVLDRSRNALKKAKGNSGNSIVKSS